ncbi:MAG TPA: glutaredoxin family protein [Steroidobacter sp.]
MSSPAAGRPMPRWTVYSRAECSLCEQMLEELARLIGPEAARQVQVIDVDSDPELARRYGSKVPVLMADGEFVCAWRLDEQRVRAHLS